MIQAVAQAIIQQQKQAEEEKKRQAAEEGQAGSSKAPGGTPPREAPRNSALTDNMETDVIEAVNRMKRVDIIESHEEEEDEEVR